MASLAATTAQDLASWGIQKLYDYINAAAVKARAEGDRIKENTHKIALLFKAADSMPAGSQKDATIAKLRTLSRQQAQVILGYKSFVDKWKSAMSQVASWVRAAGLTPPTFALAGMGAAPLIVPVAIVAGVVAVVAYVATLAYNNRNIANAAEAHRALLAKYLDGQLTWDQYQAAADNANAASAAAAKAGGYGGLQATLEAAMPILLLIGAIMLLPQLTSAFQGMRRRTA